jgi:GH43 family beta-xylosidase
MYGVMHYIGPAENGMNYRYNVMVINTESKEGVMVTHVARKFTEIKDDQFFPNNCIKLHRDLTDRFRNEKDELLVLMKILRADE